MEDDKIVTIQELTVRKYVRDLPTADLLVIFREAQDELFQRMLGKENV